MRGGQSSARLLAAAMTTKMASSMSHHHHPPGSTALLRAVGSARRAVRRHLEALAFPQPPQRPSALGGRRNRDSLSNDGVEGSLEESWNLSLSHQLLRAAVALFAAVCLHLGGGGADAGATNLSSSAEDGLLQAVRLLEAATDSAAAAARGAFSGSVKEVSLFFEWQISLPPFSPAVSMFNSINTMLKKNFMYDEECVLTAHPRRFFLSSTKRALHPLRPPPLRLSSTRSGRWLISTLMTPGARDSPAKNGPHAAPTRWTRRPRDRKQRAPRSAACWPLLATRTLATYRPRNSSRFSNRTSAEWDSI
jgi:hypothetical protein